MRALCRTSDPNINMKSIQTTRPRESKGQKKRWFPTGQSSDWLSTQLSWLGKPPPIIDGQLYPLHVLRTHSLEAGRDKTWATVRFWFYLMVTFQAWTQADKLGQIGPTFLFLGKRWFFWGQYEEKSQKVRSLGSLSDTKWFRQTVATFFPIAPTPVSQWVSGSFRLEIAIASPSDTFFNTLYTVSSASTVCTVSKVSTAYTVFAVCTVYSLHLIIGNCR